MTAMLGALLAPAAADAAPVASSAATKRVQPPVVTKVTPMSAAIGDTIKIHGRNFRRGKAKNSVVFKRDGARAVFVKADLSTTKVMTVKVPKTLEQFLVVRDGAPAGTRFRVRVLAMRLGKSFTTLAKSPTIGLPKPPTAPGSGVDPDKSGSANPDGDCDGDTTRNSVDPDDDNDLLADAHETGMKLDPCKLDTDGDGVQDGYEWRSALDLNDDEDEEPNTFLPYPGKRPYPNALDPSDASVDFDGDSLSLTEEQGLWLYSVAHGSARTLDALTYSDGEQYTISTRGADGRRHPALASAGYDKLQCFLDWADPTKTDTCVQGETERSYLKVAIQGIHDPWYAPRTLLDIRDVNRDGSLSADEVDLYDAHGDDWLSDDERDEDADGLTNFQEARGCMRVDYWKGIYAKETPYYRTFAGTDLADEDSDGDGVRDGADDQDNDDLPNLMECSRSAAGGGWPTDGPALNDPPADGRPDEAFVNPYNPCLPSVTSRTCSAKVPVGGGGWAPFNPNDKYFFIYQ